MEGYAVVEAADGANMVGHDTVLHLGTRMRDDILMFQGLRNKIVTQEHHVVRSGSTSVRASLSVSVSVDNKLEHRYAVVVEASWR
jgi:hypothetical protein